MIGKKNNIYVTHPLTQNSSQLLLLSSPWKVSTDLFFSLRLGTVISILHCNQPSRAGRHHHHHDPRCCQNMVWSNGSDCTEGGVSRITVRSHCSLVQERSTLNMRSDVGMDSINSMDQQDRMQNPKKTNI